MVMAITGRFAGLSPALHDEASKRTGRKDFGNPADYWPGLDTLLRAIDDDAVGFDDTGAARVSEMIVGTLVARLYAEAGWQARPDCLANPIQRPLIITGIPRTGTTALHRLLNLDPGFQALPRWLSLYPMPRPPRESWDSIHEYRDDSGVASDLAAIHHMAAGEVDECIHLLKQDFCSNFWGASLPVPSYDRWWVKQDETASYVRSYRLLQLIGADDPATPWLLKNPGHLGHLEVLLSTMPDAVVVQTHRDPIQAIASLASLMAKLLRRNTGGAVDPMAIGRRELLVWRDAARDAMAVRDRLIQAGGTTRFVDVRHAEFHADPLGVVRTIYAAIDRELTRPVEAAMRARVKHDPERRQGAHSYAAATFGLDRDEVDAAFEWYRASYDL
jgi:hypothetical protein